MSGNGAPKADKVAGAIAAVGEQEKVMRHWAVTIASTGRQAIALLPPDATDGEIGEFCGWVLSQVMNAYRTERAQSAGASRIQRVATLPPGLSGWKKPPQ